jgi:hypothetical protein
VVASRWAIEDRHEAVSRGLGLLGL